MIKLPENTRLFPTSQGALLVSPSHATYCAIYPNEISKIEAILAGKKAELSPELLKRLDEHGFFAGPRPLRPHWRLIQFQVTNACNLRCQYCAADSGCARKNELTKDDIIRTIDEALELDPDINFSFTGGEPLIVPWIFDVMDYAISRSPNKVGLLSNLCLLKTDDKKADKIAEYIHNNVDVLMSISGVDREVCNRVSGVDCFDDALAVIDKLAAREAYPHLDVMLSAPDIDANIQAFADFRRRIPKEIKLTVSVLYPCGREKGKLVFASEDALQSALDEIAFEGGVSIAAPKCSKVTFRREACHCVENENLYIRSDGGIYSCFKLVDCFGHISEGLKTVQERRRANSIRAKNLAMCKNCPFVSLCASGCRADNLIFEESKKAPVCGPWRQKIIAEMLFEDKDYVLDWHVMHQLAEARKRGFETPKYLITSI